MKFLVGDRVKDLASGTPMGVVFGPDTKPGHVIICFYDNRMRQCTLVFDESDLALDMSPIQACPGCQVKTGYGHSIYCQGSAPPPKAPISSPDPMLCRAGRATDPVVSAEAPCRACGRANDVGVGTCWCCGGTP